MSQQTRIETLKRTAVEYGLAVEQNDRYSELCRSTSTELMITSPTRKDGFLQLFFLTRKGDRELPVDKRSPFANRRHSVRFLGGQRVYAWGAATKIKDRFSAYSYLSTMADNK